MSTMKASCALFLAVTLLASASTAWADDDLKQYAGDVLSCAPLHRTATVSSVQDGETSFKTALTNGMTTMATSDVMNKEFAVYPTNADGKKLSFWHDIPLFPNNSDSEYIVNFVPEIPKGTLGKMEIIKGVESNPIMFDTKDVKDSEGNVLYTRPRYTAYGPYPRTYGAVPQTWENSEDPDPETGITGDNDPIDAFDIGTAVPPIGYPYQAKVLGALGLIDDNETDWKLVLINTMDPNAANYNSVEDVPEDLMDELFVYNRDKPTAVGEPQSVFWPNMTSSYDPTVWVGAEKALEIIKHANQQYTDLMGDCAKVKEMEFSYAGCA